MKRITTNGDIQFPIESVRKLKGIEEYTIKFFTTSKTVNVRKTNNDVIDGIIPLEWPELSTLGTGVLNYLVEIPNPDPNYSDDIYNNSFTGTTIYYIISNIIIPDEDEVQDLMQLVSEIRTDLNAEITRSTGEDQEHDTKLADVYTKEEIRERLSGKADKNGNINESFNVLGLNLRREGANTTLYNYNVDNNEFVSFYDQTGGSLTYKFTPNQGDNIATEKQLAGKANISDVYTKTDVDSLVGGIEYELEEPSGKLPKFSGNTIRILGIGNSYMTEGTRELEGFLTNSGLTENNLDLEIAYYPSRNLSTWYNCIKDGGGYEQLVQFKYNSSENYWYRTAQHNVEDIRETISEKTWDVIVLQEFPSFSDSENASEYFSYEIYLKNVITLIKDLCPNPNLCFGWHMIWSNDQNLSNNGMVWEKICDAVKHTIKHSDISFIIPSGTALQNAYNTTPFRGYEHHFLLMDEIGHPASGAARYITAATFYEALISPIFGKSLLENQYLPIFTSESNTTFSDSEVPITASNILPAKYSAISACKNRYFVDYNIESFIAQNYTKNEVNALLAEKANKNGNGDLPFNTYTLNLHREGANTALFNYKVGDYSTISFYDDSLGGIHYTFTPNQEDIIATERQLALKANTSDVYSKTDVDSLLGGKADSNNVYSKTDVNSLLAGKANKNGSVSEIFTTKTLNLQREGGSSSLYNYSVNDEDYISIYDRTGGSLTYKFTANQGDNIATERQLAEKANSTDVYSKNDIDTKLNGKAGYKSYNTLQDMEADTTQPNGTIGFDSNAKNFYIFDSGNAEWKPIDQTGGGGSGTGESKIVLYAIVDEDDDTCTIQNTEHETLTCSAVKALLNDPTKDVVLRTYDPNDDHPNYIEYRLYSYYDDTDLETYYFFYSDESNIYIIDLDATRSYTDTWDCYTSTYTIPTSPGKLGIGFGTQNNTSTSSVSAIVNNYQKVVGGIVAIKFTKTLAHAPQLNINGTGSSYIYFRGAFCPANTIQSGDIVTMVYTGSAYEILSITTNRSNDASDVTYTASGGIIRVDTTRYKTYKIKDYFTTVPSGTTTGIQFRFSKNTNYNTEPVTTLILRAENYSKIDWSALSVSFYSQISGTSTEVTIKWKDNDSPINTLAHLGNGVDYVVIKVYEGEYGTYEAW